MLDTATLRFAPAAADVMHAAIDIPLTQLPLGASARVVSVASANAKAPAELARRLAELGFLPGESVRIVARGVFSRAPVAVRVGTGTFALRVFEAACIRVSVEQPQT